MISAAQVLFDLDGTLIDPAGAITGGIGHALEVHGIEDPGPASLNALVGPGLAHGLASIPGVEPELIPALIDTYRTHYLERGMALARVYPGITELLTALAAAGVPVAVATSKPTSLARLLIDQQGLAPLLGGVYGAPEAESAAATEGKEAIVAAALAGEGMDPATTVMVGDRRFDLTGASANGLRSIGVRWGFAPPGELEAAGADAIVHDAHELAALLLPATTRTKAGTLTTETQTGTTTGAAR
ncbi:HAD hydrolase-like protein [Paeniglutamicibacter cryotolerans]|nr:HAD hydrolase-like protein [Paeniglutamicibacter cryotolerans]